jgi:hypothetical protein
MFMRLYLVLKDRKSHGLSESITKPGRRSQSLISRTNLHRETQAVRCHPLRVLKNNRGGVN